MCCSFGSASHDLCSALTEVGRRLCSSLVNPESISARRLPLLAVSFLLTSVLE